LSAINIQSYKVVTIVTSWDQKLVEPMVRGDDDSSGE